MRKVCVITGSRADYGLLRPLMRLIDAHESLQLQVLVTGAHLVAAYGLSVNEIREDGFVIDRCVDSVLASDTPGAIAKSFGLVVSGVADALADLRPDLVVLLGDRYETLGAGVAAMTNRVPIAHIHGGERTEGAIDEAIRHSLTKMSHLHFVAAEEYRDRVVQMGENPDRVWVVGALGLDSMAELEPMSRDELENSLGASLAQSNFLVTYSPVTLDPEATERELVGLLVALDRFPDANVFITLTSPELEGNRVRNVLSEFADARKDRVFCFANLGQRRYLSLMRVVDTVIGNSSSGIIEAPSIGVTTVNIGPRQQGRLRASTVIDCGASADEIAQGIAAALERSSGPKLRPVDYPYGSVGASARIMRVLLEHPLRNLNAKTFVDFSHIT